ncbi:mitochondrial escape protein 2 [Pseudogymnoascus destructans]|uniref:Mitochondrial escape protein 2 n=1 Tax=Pseudogymnoascus destructans TaxID=655981 RepID=A0A177AK81_9PEZI|nr:mitochondrial escape protein 2 [Pseudogymnoascus destructans]OAF62200.1 mitochondrial escape protein 2 [Pseudogymnoascus destructans]
MSIPARRAVFNPTSIPELRPRRAYIQPARTIPGRPPAGRPKNWSWRVVRKESTEVGKDHSGHIEAHTNEGILFFDSIFPLRFNVGMHMRLPFFRHRNLPELLERFNSASLQALDPMVMVKRAIPPNAPITVTEILPRIKDGGAFVKFSHPDGVSSQEVESLIIGYLKEKYVRPWFNPMRPMKANLVRGVPWLEDLHRFPSSRIKVEFAPTKPGGEAAELSQETLYSLFRRYGMLAEISSQPADSKVLPRFATLDFARLRNAVMARNCMHGFKVLEEAGGGVGGTQLRLSYEQKIKAHMIRDWVMGHPRIFIPLMAALLGTLAVAVFDPIRTFFIKAHVTHSLKIRDSRIYKWFSSQAKDIFTFKKRNVEEAGLGAIWDDRRKLIDQLQTWMMETTDTFIIVQGPRGSGKRELVLDQALKDHRNVLLIDCKPIQEARGDSTTINSIAQQVGYRPVFSWMNSFSSLIDLAAQGTIGVKSGFSETLDTQLGKILSNTATALKQIGLEDRDKHDKDASMTDDDYLESHPERRPTIVIDNFLHKNEDSSVVYDKIAEWAAGLTTANIAHVIFLTNNISYSKSLGRALPDRVFRQIALGDITPAAAKRFVITHLDTEEDPSGTDSKLSEGQRRQDLSKLDACIDVLGGRLTDLEFLARRLKTGQSPQQAVEEIIEQSASEIMKIFLLAARTNDREDRTWSPEQAWFLIEQLAKAEALRYNEVLLSNTFASSLTPSASNGEAVLNALAQAELISIKTAKGRPESIRPGKPVYHAAFKILTEDKVLKARMNLAVLAELSKIEGKSIDKCEAELALIAGMPRVPPQVAPRVEYLLGKVEASQRKVEQWDREMGGLKRVLMREY